MKDRAVGDRGIKKGFGLTMATRFLTLGAATIISCLLISLGIFQFRQARNMTNIVNHRMTELESILTDADISVCDGMIFRGSDVVNLFRKYMTGESDYEFVVRKNSQEYILSRAEQVVELTTPTKGSYCNPAESFICALGRNVNGVLIRVSFTGVE